jgi:hypothetical protein
MKQPLKFLLWIALAAGLAALFVSVCRRPDQVTPISTTRSVREPGLSPAFAPTLPQRTVYPYSVIPGGVASPEELKTIIKRNPEIARHFEDFDLEKAKLLRVATPRSVYVSYRFGNLIFWTTRKLSLKEGEYLITDGTRTIRGRCGNDVSEIPKEPTSPAEPTTRELEAPLPPSVVPPPYLTGLPPNITVSTNPPNPPTNPPNPPPGNVPPTAYSGPPPVYPIIDPSGGFQSAPSSPLAPTPEPSSLLLLSLGGTAIAVKSMWGKVRGFRSKRKTPRVRLD